MLKYLSMEKVTTVCRSYKINYVFTMYVRICKGDHL